MRYRGILTKIENLAKDYKGFVDGAAASYKATVAATEKEIEKNKDMWREDYQEQYRQDHSPDKQTRETVKKRRDKDIKEATALLNRLETSIDSFIGGKVSQNFATKIMAYKSTGLELTATEADILFAQARTYPEKRLAECLLLQIDRDRPRTNFADIRPSYEVPDADDIKRSFNEYKNAALFYFKNYSGGDHELINVVAESDAILAAAADSFFRSNKTEEILTSFEYWNEFCPDNSLTDIEKHRIDEKIDPKYEALARQKAKEWAAEDPEAKELLQNDPRYVDAIKG